MEALIEIKPKRKPFQRIYLGIMLWFVGRAIQAAARVDKQVKKEFKDMPTGYTFSLGAFPNGPYMIVGKDDKGKVRYLGSNLSKHPADLEMTLKSMKNLFVLFTSPRPVQPSEFWTSSRFTCCPKPLRNWPSNDIPDGP